MNFGWTITTVIAVVSLLSPTISAIVDNIYNRRLETLKLRIANLNTRIKYERQLIHRLNIVRGKLEFHGPVKDGSIQEEVISVAADASTLFHNQAKKIDFEKLQSSVLQDAINYREYIRTCLDHLSNLVLQDQQKIVMLLRCFNKDDIHTNE